MRHVTLEDFLAAPVGTYVTGKTWLYFYPTEDFSGWSAWGRPTCEDFDALAEVLRATLSPTARRRPRLLDFRFLEGAEPGLFEHAAKYVLSGKARLARSVTRMALLRSGGLMGAVTAGFFEVLNPLHEVRVFTEPVEALGWLGNSVGVSVLDEIEELRIAASGEADFIHALRTMLEGDFKLTMPRVAAHFSLSERTFQRRLGDAGTSFKNELNRARVRKAQRLLLETKASLSFVAFEVGCSSPQHFSTLFRRITGETPAAWRERHPNFVRL